MIVEHRTPAGEPSGLHLTDDSWCWCNPHRARACRNCDGAGFVRFFLVGRAEPQRTTCFRCRGDGLEPDSGKGTLVLIHRHRSEPAVHRSRRE